MRKYNETYEDIRFSSPSAASNFITSLSTNGWDKWKTKDGITLKEITGKAKEASRQKSGKRQKEGLGGLL